MTDLFSANLIQWYRENKRDLPWRETSDPYRIWVSEIMLQQTRVDTVIPYYHRFLEVFPTVTALAEADQQQVLKIWEGLGYYSRARNLHSGARYLMVSHNGEVPQNRAELLNVKGIGTYTAAAILSIAFGQKHAVVDGNVLRVLSRYAGIREDIRSGRVVNEIQKIADQLIPDDHPGDFNQALMELGATLCKPVSPLCNNCPLSSGCKAWNLAETDTIPYKSPAKKIPHYEIAAGLILNEKLELLIALRPEHGMLGGLWEFPGGKKEQGETLEETVKRELLEELGVQVRTGDLLISLNHTYSHFKITLHAYWCRIISGVPSPQSSQQLRWVSADELDVYPFPKANKLIIKRVARLDTSDLENVFGKI